jgi:hypothetical protein
VNTVDVEGSVRHKTRFVGVHRIYLEPVADAAILRTAAVEDGLLGADVADAAILRTAAVEDGLLGDDVGSANSGMDVVHHHEGC